MTGTTIAQAIPVAISPILTRIYSPEDFGVFAIYISIVTILSVIVTGAYDLAIVIPKKDADALYIIKLSFLVTSVISFIVLLIVFFFNNQIVLLIGDENLRTWLYFIPFSIFLSGIYQSVNYWLNRHRYYKSIAINRVIQSGTAGSVQLAMGFIGLVSSGLILGKILGQLVSTILLGKIYLQEKKRLKSQKKKLKLIALAKRYKKFPLYESRSNLLNTSSTEVPVILISSLFNTGVAGFYALSSRMLLLPMTLIGTSIGQVFFQEASKLKSNKNELRNLTFSIYKKLVLIGVVPISFIIVYGDFIFMIIFGDEWRVAGEYSQVLGIWIILVFISSPLSKLLVIMEKQKEALNFNILIFLSRVLSIVVGFMIFEDPYNTILLFGITGAVFWLFWCKYILGLVGIKFDVVLLELLKYLIPSLSIFIFLRVIL